MPAAEAVLIYMSCQMALALRPRVNPSSMVSRYGSQALAKADGLVAWSCWLWNLTYRVGGHSLAGFAALALVLASLAGVVGRRRPMNPRGAYCDSGG